MTKAKLYDVLEEDFRVEDIRLLVEQGNYYFSCDDGEDDLPNDNCFYLIPQ